MDTTESSYLNFLQDIQVYDKLEQMWQQWFSAFAQEHSINLVSFYNLYDINGNKERDANPIFSALEPSKKRLIRLLQTPVEEAQEIYIQGWLDVFGKEKDDEGIEELVIDLVLSEKAKNIAKNWIKAWLVDELPKTELEIMTDNQSILCD